MSIWKNLLTGQQKGIDEYQRHPETLERDLNVWLSADYSKTPRESWTVTKREMKLEYM